MVSSVLFILRQLIVIASLPGRAAVAAAAETHREEKS